MRGTEEGDFVTVARRLDPIAAELLRGRLAADGIPVRLADAHLVQAYSLGAAALGGVRVMVPASWAPQASRAIAAVEQGDLALDEAGPAGADPGGGASGQEPAKTPWRLDSCRLGAAGMALALVLAAFAASSWR